MITREQLLEGAKTGKYVPCHLPPIELTKDGVGGSDVEEYRTHPWVASHVRKGDQVYMPDGTKAVVVGVTEGTVTIRSEHPLPPFEEGCVIANLATFKAEQP